MNYPAPINSWKYVLASRAAVVFFFVCLVLLVSAKPDTNTSQPTPSGISIGSATGKTVVMKTGSLTSTATTADQVILTYTVTSGKTFYMEYVTVTARLTTYAATATNFGNSSLESPAATKLITTIIANAGVINPPFAIEFGEPIPIASGTVIRVVCTPAATTSFLWQANFGGYERAPN